MSKDIEKSSDIITCMLCLSNKSELIQIFGEKGYDLNIFFVVTKHFWFQIKEDTFCCICKSCWKQLEDFHKFYCIIEKLHTSTERPKMLLDEKEKVGEKKVGIIGDSNGNSNTTIVYVKNEYPDESYEIADISDNINDLSVSEGNVDSPVTLENILNQNTSVQDSKDVDAYATDESSTNGYAKRRKRNSRGELEETLNLADTGDGNSFYYNDTLDVQVLNDPGGTQAIEESPSSSVTSELERLRRENELLKMQNKSLMGRLKDAQGQNKLYERINQDLATKLQMYEHRQDGVNVTEIQNKMIPLTNAYVYENGDVNIMDVVIPSRTMAEIEAVDPGEKGDTKFISKLAVAIWGKVRLSKSSITGRKSNNSNAQTVSASIQLEPEKVHFIKEKVYNRAILETNDRTAAMARFEDSRVNRLLNIKIQNLKRILKKELD